MFIDLQSKWFQAYCRALLEADREQAQVYVEDALERIDERLRRVDVSEEEREAISTASRYLKVMAGEKLPKAA